MAEGGRSRARTWAAELDAARRRAGLAWPYGLVARASRLRDLLSAWALAEVAPGRLLPWLAVAFGFGIAVYFTAEREPAVWAPMALAAASVAVAVLARRRAVGFPLALGFAAIACGFAVATLQATRLSHPVLSRVAANATLSGFVEAREQRERSDRIVVRIHRFEAPRITDRLERVRVSVRKGTAPAVGSFVELRAYLSPPLQPLRPGGYDFARDMYFQGIGASGYALGAIRTVPAPAAAVPPWDLSYDAAIDGFRESVNSRIRAILPGDRGAIASALITGKRDAITAAVNEAMYISSLGHVLSISGYHMAVVAGIVFFVIRALLALSPSLAIRRPIKKWAAAGALVAAAFYLVLSGAAVATQRSFIMTAIVLIGVMADRPAITFRTLTLAALAVLLIAPQALVHPSFQMSFAATLALVAAYQHGLPKSVFGAADRDSSVGARAALWGGREIAGLVLVSVVAGFATTLYAAYHFHRLAPYGVIANLLAMPLVSTVVMPMGILGTVTMPFGFDAPFWRLMGLGIDWMIGVATWVSSLPGAVGRIHAFGIGPLLLGTAALLMICLLRTRLRWSGVALALAACLWAAATPRPDILVSADGQTAALRGADGRLTVLASGRDSFAVKAWLAADGDDRGDKDVSLKGGVRCDPIGCIGTLREGRLASYVHAVEAFAEDCSRAAVVISPRQSQTACAALLLDRTELNGQSAIALRWAGNRFERTDARPPGYERPWARRVPDTAEAAVTPARPVSRDATPREEDREAGD